MGTPNPTGDRQDVADLILDRAMIHPASWEAGSAISLAIAGGRIAYVGPEEGATPWRGPRTKRIDLAGRMVLPGFVDAHLHPLLGGIGLLECNLAGLTTLTDYQRAVRAHADAHPDSAFLRGGGWTGGAFPGERPTRDMLDAAVSDRPAFLKAMDGHSMWANSCALRAAAIHARTPDPPGGFIEKDPRTGEPTGWLKEWSAMALVEACFPPPTRDQRMRGARLFMEKAAQAGITSASEAMLTDDEHHVYAELDARNELTVRIHGMALCRPEDGDAERERVRCLLHHPPSPRYHVRAVKLFLDGVIEAHTAWLKEPYTDQPDNRGTLIWNEDAFLREVDRWNARGVSLHIHAIGDAAVQLAVDAIEEAARRHAPREVRHQIAHLDMVRPEEIPRLARLGIHAVVQPAWFYVDHAFFDTTLPALGRERASRLYPLNTLLRAGVPVACSSDWPFGGDTAAFAPLEGIQVAATRLGLDGAYPTVYQPGECAPLRDLLDAYTLGGARTQFRESRIGALRAGMRADLVVLDGDLYERAPNGIHSTRILLTLMDGRPVHHAADWTGL